MEPSFSKIFHKSSKDHSKGHPPYSFDSNEWPEEWKTTYYKSYPRLPKIELDDPPSPSETLAKEGADFFDLIKKRKSRRDFTRAPMTLRELSLLLKRPCLT